jgi:hypothetical protein
LRRRRGLKPRACCNGSIYCFCEEGLCLLISQTIPC